MIFKVTINMNVIRNRDRNMISAYSNDVRQWAMPQKYIYIPEGFTER